MNSYGLMGEVGIFMTHIGVIGWKEIMYMYKVVLKSPLYEFFWEKW